MPKLKDETNRLRPIPLAFPLGSKLIIHSLPDTFLEGGLMVYYSSHHRAYRAREDTMSDNLRRYRAIRDAIKQLYPTEPRGNTARHVNTLAMLISGIVGP